MKRMCCCAVIFAFVTTALPVAAGERTIVGAISKIDLENRSFSVTDGTGAMWNYKGAPGADPDLTRFDEGDRVSVTIARATPLNMMVSADSFRKGDKIVKIPY